MGVFDDAWWAERMVGDHGVIDLQDTEHSSTVGAWVRWRLIDDLMTRFYVDYGLEGVFTEGLYQMRLASPTCERERRYFGRICAFGPHVAVAEDTPDLDSASLDPYRVQIPVEGDLDSHGRVWSSYADYLRAVVRDLGLAEASVVGHEKCFHRRGRSAAQLAFRLALLLRTGNGGEIAADDSLVTVTSEHEPYLREVAPWFREPLVSGAPRWLLVTSVLDPEQSDDDGELHFEPSTDAWVVTNEGLIHHEGGTVNARDQWRSGSSEDEIVAELTGIEAI